MLIPRSAVDALASRLDRSGGSLRSASVEIDIDPLDLVRSGWQAVGHASFFASPDGYTIGGLGVARRMVTSGQDRLLALDDELSRLPDGLPVVAGFAFDPDAYPGSDWEGFPPAAAVVPEIAIVRSSGTSRLYVTSPPGSEGHHLLSLLAGLSTPPQVAPFGEAPRSASVPSTEEWASWVEEAVEAIRSGSLDKVVLARSVVLTAHRAVPAFDVVSRLRDHHPECRVFGWQEAGSTFVGASPELLVTRVGPVFRVEPLAGSASRGADPDEDRRIGDALLASSKDREEHRIVVDDAIRRLEPLVDDLTHPPVPVLHRLATVQHLGTPISGNTSARVLRLADALHPTPAVGGAPRAAALSFIDKVEMVERGWYSGGVGWLDVSGNGELAVALRCALVSAERAILFAGNGIVAGSDPEDELEETRLKLMPMREAFG